MSGNSFGTLFRIMTFGESHGQAVGVVIDGCPAGLILDRDLILRDMGRRKPGQSAISTQRQEEDEIQIMSGIFGAKTTGAPILMMVFNKDQRPGDYVRFKDTFRPSHADFTYEAKYGFRDYRGGGRSSARETLARVAAGAVAKTLLKEAGISIQAYVRSIGEVALSENGQELDFAYGEQHPTRCPDPEIAARMQAQIEEVRAQGDSLGGIVSCIIRNCPAGLGEPVFDKLHAELGKAMLSINAVKGFEIGSGFAAATMRGSQHNDAFVTKENKPGTRTNYSGGIQGGISNGEEIYFNVAFKPVATIAQKQQTINREGEEVEIEGKGRHDPCVVPRAVPIVEAMAALVLADHWLRTRTSRL